jgi:Flp pilus assembly protein TadG
VLRSVDVAGRPLVVLADVQEMEFRAPLAELVRLHRGILRGNTHPHNEAVAKRRATRDGFYARESGQALVETALSLSLLVFTILGGADIARAFAAQMGVQNSARAGAEAWATRAATTDAQAIAYATDELGRIAGVDPAAATITVTHTTGAGGESLVNVRVQYTYRTLAPWPFVPNSLSLDKTATFRNYP